MDPKDVKIKVQGTKDLFDEMIANKHSIQNIAGIVQNDTIITKQDVHDMWDSTSILIDNLISWRQRVRDLMWVNQITEEEAIAYQEELDSR